MEHTEYVFLTLPDIQRQLDRILIPALRDAAGTAKEVQSARRIGDACLACIPKVARGGWDLWISDRQLSKDEAHLFMRMASGMTMDQANAHGSLTMCATALHIVMPNTLVTAATTPAEPDDETQALAQELANARTTIEDLRTERNKLKRALTNKSKQLDKLKAELG